MEKAVCPLCNNTENVEFRPNSLYECPICGRFQLPLTFDIASYMNDDCRLKVRHAVKKNNLQEENKGLLRQSLILENEAVDEINANYKIPKLLEKIDLVLEHIESKTNFISQAVAIDIDTLFPLFFCKNNYELLQIIKYLKENDYIKLNHDIHVDTEQVLVKEDTKEFFAQYDKNYYCNRFEIHGEQEFLYLEKYGMYGLYLTTKGLKYLSEKKKNNINSKQGFVAMWFNNNSEPEKYRPNMQNVYSVAIKPAIEFEDRFTSIKIDNVEHCNDINDEMISQIRKSRFMIADLTGYRGGVYWEAGFAEGLGIPVIYTCHEKWLNTDEDLNIEGVHFDLNHRNMILWNEENLEEFKQRLINRIGAIIV